MKNLLPFSPKKNRLIVKIIENKIQWAYFHSNGKVSFGCTETDGKNLLELKSSLPAKPSRVVLVIEREQILTKTFKLPSTNSEELERIVAFKLPQELPYSTSEIVYHFEVDRITNDGYAEVGIAWMLKKNVEEKLRLLKNLELEVDEVLSSSQGLLFYYLKSREKDNNLPLKTIFLNLDQTESELLILEGEKILLSRSIKKGVEALSYGNDVYIRELKGEIDSLEKEGLFKKPLTICLAGPSETIESLGEPLSRIAGISIKLLPLSSIIPLEERAAASTDVIGANYYESFRSWSFLPEELKRVRDEAHKASVLGQITICFVVIAISSLASLYSNLLNKEIEKNRLDKELHDLHPKIKQVLHIAQEMEVIEKLQEKKTVPLEFLAALGPLMPPQITLTELNYDEKEGFRLRGLGETYQMISEFIKAIKTIPKVSKADFDFSRRKIQEGKEYFDFQISAKIDWNR